MCLQLLGTGVTLHMACPGFVDTPMIRAAQNAAVRCQSQCFIEQVTQTSSSKWQRLCRAIT